MPRTARRSGLAALLLLTTGCAGGGSPEETREALQASRASVRALAQDVAATLGAAGLEVEGLTGAYRTCRSEPSPGLRYIAGGATAALDDDPVAPRLAEVRDALEADGWTVTAARGDVLSAEREGARAGVGRTTRSGVGVVAFDTTGACVDADPDETDALLGETETEAVPPR